MDVVGQQGDLDDAEVGDPVQQLADAALLGGGQGLQAVVQLHQGRRAGGRRPGGGQPVAGGRLESAADLAARPEVAPSPGGAAARRAERPTRVLGTIRPDPGSSWSPRSRRSAAWPSRGRRRGEEERA